LGERYRKQESERVIDIEEANNSSAARRPSFMPMYAVLSPLLIASPERKFEGGEKRLGWILCHGFVDSLTVGLWCPVCRDDLRGHEGGMAGE